MESASLKGRAIVFALCAGAMVFILALLATAHGELSADTMGRALIPAIVCSVLSWAAAERSIASTAAAIDSAIARIEFANGLLMLFGKSRIADAEKLYKDAAKSTPADAMERLDVELAKSELE